MTTDEHGRPGDAGFTLIEVIAAMALLLLASTAILYGTLNAQRLSGDSRARVIATNLAADEVERAQALSLVDLDALATTVQTRTVSERDYTVVTSGVWQARTGAGSPCDSASGSAFAFKRVSVRVTWPDMGTTVPVRSDTVISPGVGSFDPNLGSVAVRVRDSRGLPVELVSVALSGPEAKTLLTDESGCAFFHQLTPANTYRVVATAPNRVGILGSPTAERANIAVSTGATTAVQLDYDTAASLRVLAPVGHPVPATVSVALGHSSVPAPGYRRVTGGTWPLTVNNLYPFPAGYRTWLGLCSDADPEAVRQSGGNTVSFWGSESSTAPVAVAARGGSSEVQAAGARVEVAVNSPLGTRRSGVTVTATHVGTDGCPSGESHVLGATDAQGVVRATLPYGKDWQIRATLLPTGIDLPPNGSYPRRLTVIG